MTLNNKDHGQEDEKQLGPNIATPVYTIGKGEKVKIKILPMMPTISSIVMLNGVEVIGELTTSWHSGPRACSAHSQWNEPIVLIHRPPLWHGLRWHSSMSYSQ